MTIIITKIILEKESNYGYLTKEYLSTHSLGHNILPFRALEKGL